jgi:hypothetical protein
MRQKNSYEKVAQSLWYWLLGICACNAYLIWEKRSHWVRPCKSQATPKEYQEPARHLSPCLTLAHQPHLLERREVGERHGELRADFTSFQCQELLKSTRSSPRARRRMRPSPGGAPTRAARVETHPRLTQDYPKSR